MRHPKREMRRVRKHIEQLQIVLSAANLHDAISSARKVLQIEIGIKKWNRVRRAARGAGHEDRPKFAFESRLDRFAAFGERMPNSRWPAAQGCFVWNEHEVAGLLRVLGRIQQIE